MYSMHGTNTGHVHDGHVRYAAIRETAVRVTQKKLARITNISYCSFNICTLHTRQSELAPDTTAFRIPLSLIG